MIELWLAVSALTLIAVTFILVPIIRYQTDETKLAASSEWFTNRKQELEQEFKAGLFSEQEYQQALTELKLTAKDELINARTEQGKGHSKVNNKKPVLLAAVLMLLIVVPFYLIKGHYPEVGYWQQTMAKLPELSKKIVEQNSQQVTMQELNDFALGLRTKLAAKEDPVGWMLLGRVLMSMNDVDGGIAAFEKSYKLAPRNPSNTLSYAQALQLRGEEWQIKRSLTLLQEVMQMQPQNETAVILFGEANLMLQNYPLAQKSFEFAKKMVSQDDPRMQGLDGRLNFIAQQLAPQSTDVGEPLLNIQVQLSEQLKDQLAQFKYLFVFAKTGQMPMPIAVKKLAIADFPAEVQLSNADFMLPEQSLADYPVVNLFARLSLDDQALLASGEWQGQVDNVSTQEKNTITIVIDKEQP